ncbi:MAG TPA: Gfo/Idh/MocA family oxidoreductase, partial [Bryobacteraceae bacterium]|nr:Gfo/Idh/MocA family oxidoreductase [Bryobacteraceae bacterium]
MTGLRFGLVGCGRIGATADDRVNSWAVADLWLPYSHASAITATEGAELVAVCDVDSAAAEAARIRHGARASYTDLEAMLASEDLDVLAIATRARHRGEIIRTAIRHGIRGLYCEKPLTNSLEDADELVSAVERAGVAFVYGTKRRFMPVYRRVRDRIAAGELGQATNIIIRFGYGTLLWSLPHAVDIAQFLAGDAAAETIQADLSLVREDVNAAIVDCDPGLNMASIRFSNGIRAILVPGYGMDVQVAGPLGLVSIEADGANVRWRRALSDGSDIGWLLEERVDP